MSGEDCSESAPALAEQGLLQFPQRAAYPCVRLFWKGRERNCGNWKNENGHIHHRAGGSAGGGAFRYPRLRDGYGGRADARRALARVQPRCDFYIRANPSARCAADRAGYAADCDIRTIRRARDADCHNRARRRADCDNRTIRRATIRAQYADTRAVDLHNRADRRANIRAGYADARAADCDNLAQHTHARADCANIRARHRADCDNLAINDNRARRYADSPNRNIRARADRHLHADALANRNAGSPDADARANRNAGSPDADLHARAAARRQRQGGQRRRRARARFHAQFRGRLIAHRRESAG